MEGRHSSNSDTSDSTLSRGGTVVARRSPAYRSVDERANQLAATWLRAIDDSFQILEPERENRERLQKAFLEETRRAYGSQTLREFDRSESPLPGPSSLTRTRPLPDSYDARTPFRLELPASRIDTRMSRFDGGSQFRVRQRDSSSSAFSYFSVDSSNLKHYESPNECGTAQQDGEDNEIYDDRIDQISVEALHGSVGEDDPSVERGTEQNYDNGHEQPSTQDGTMGFAKFKDHRGNYGDIVFTVEFGRDSDVDLSWNEVKTRGPFLQKLCARYIKEYVPDATRRGPRPLNDWAENILKTSEE